MSLLTAEKAKARAIALVGAEDFGPAGLDEGLERTLAGFAELQLKPATAEEAMSAIVASLANRLRIEAWYKQHPEIENQKIDGPVLVCGLPRTGTTATVGMMALDPRYRFTRYWEMSDSTPPPQADNEANDPRAEKAREASKRYSQQDQHIQDPEGPEEDLVGIAPLNMRAYFGAFPMPKDYLDWWLNDDFVSTYAYHRRVLKLLQSQRPPYLWLLKAPLHLFKLEAFAAEYPDAKFIWTHRDPAKVIPSVSSLQHTLHSSRCVETSLDKFAAGPKALAFWTEGMRRALIAREKIGEDRFIDVWNSDVAGRPVETFADIYDKLGFQCGPDLKAKIEDYNRRNARGAFGEHRYTAEEYGLTTEEIREAFGDYVKRFDL